jgi:hypothetical protein
LLLLSLVPRYTTSNPMLRKRFRQCGTWHAQIVEAISGLTVAGNFAAAKPPGYKKP